MLKPWSITTTVRNPERLRDFLIALQPLVNRPWNKENQEKYQKLLIQKRLYGYGSQQFYNGLPRDIVDLINNIDEVIDDLTVNRIVEIKKYRDFDMRGRQSINPLTKFGFAFINNGVLKITELGKKFVVSEKDSGDVFLKSFIKWQIPNPASNDFSNNGDYGIIPFTATLKLIDEVNRLERARGEKAVGIQKREFFLFIPTLVKYTDISVYANKIIEFRALQKGKSKPERKIIRNNYRKAFAINFLGTNNQNKINKLLTNLRDYGDNTIRYFRLTKFIRIRGNGFYVDLEENRRTEIEALFENQFYKPRVFVDRNDYLSYMSDDNLPKLPWQTKEKLIGIATGVYSEIVQLLVFQKLTAHGIQNINLMSEDELIAYIDDLRAERIELQERDNHIKSQPVESISKYIEQLEKIFSFENRPLMLEYLSTMGLHSLNDAKEIKPNYPVGDDNEPTSTAPGGMADIECFYNDFNMICEVTMLKGRDQWFNEGQPVMRHLRDFESSHINSCCIFIAPTIHEDSAETFWIANTIGYKGNKQKIAPMTINQFVEILKALKRVRESNTRFTHDKLIVLIESIVESANTIGNSDDWIVNNHNIINVWSSKLEK